ncbi:hypothetical protein ACA910_010757 [Epithemia clementina (nom. ined.)]
MIRFRSKGWRHLSSGFTSSLSRRGSLSMRQIRAFSSEGLVLTNLDTIHGVATLTMNNPPVNSLSLEMFHDLSKSIKAVEENPAMKAIVLESSNPAIFSAGLDLMELHNPKITRLSEFWSSFQQLYLDLYGSRLGCVASIQGTAPAAGCMLAMCCDYRVIAADAKSKIGLNETKLGIVAPPWLSRLFMDTVGRRQGELGLSLGSLYSPQQALSIGLVDEIIDDKNRVSERAFQVAMEFASIPPHALQASKFQVRSAALQQLGKDRDGDLSYFVDFMMRDNVQQSIDVYLQQLATRKAKRS